MSRTRRVRALAVALLGAVIALVVVLVLGGGDAYVIKAQFLDAGQLIKGDLVQVGGRKVGKISGIDLADNGLAEVKLSLDDDSVQPLHRGTRAAIRTASLSGVANRYIDLSPGPPSTGAIPDGGALSPDQTRGIVDLDTVLDSTDPKVRKDIQSIVREAAGALTPKTARQTNAGLHYLNPAVSQVTALGRELTRDEAALQSLLVHTSSVAGVLARHRTALGTGIQGTATTLTAVASERRALADGLERAPRSLRLTEHTMRRIRTRTLPRVDPVLRGARPTIKPLAELLRLMGPTLKEVQPTLTSIRRLLPQSRRALAPLPKVARAASPAIASTTKALKSSRPLLSGLRPYTPEFVAGFFSGFGGSTSASYDANGHYARINLESAPNSLTGLLPRPSGGSLGGLRVGLDARCPGAAEEPAPDGSNPFATGPGAAGASCDPKDNK